VNTTGGFLRLPTKAKKNMHHS